MEFLRQRMGQLRQAWDQLSASGRMALTLTVMLVVALLVIVSHYAGSPELVPLPTHYQPEELGRAVAALKAQDIEAEVRSGQIYVPAPERSAALGMLAYSDVMPEAGVNVEKLIGSGGMWEPESDKQRRWRYAFKRELENQILGMPGVRRVSVNINYGSPRTLQSVPAGVSASIGVGTVPSSPLDKRLARAMAKLVAGYVHGLTTENIEVVDLTTGQAFDLSSAGNVYSDDYVRTVMAYTSYFKSRLLEQFSDIQGLKVNVHVVPNLDRVHKVTHTVDPRQVVDGEIYGRSSSATTGAAGGGVGVIPNAGSGQTNTASAGSDTDKEDRIGAPRDYSTEDQQTEVAPGEVKEATAAISVPRSYLIRVAQLRSGTPAEGGSEPAPVDDAAIQNVFASEKDRITKQAVKVLGVTDETAVSVDWHYDFEPAGMALASASDGGLGFTGLLTRYGSTAALGLFAVMALFMVYSVVRKFRPSDVPAESAPAEAVGEAGLTLDSILEGVELEADVIRASKMQEQISNMIKEDPESVAGLVKRWVSQE